MEKKITVKSSKILVLFAKIMRTLNNEELYTLSNYVYV